VWQTVTPAAVRNPGTTLAFHGYAVIGGGAVGPSTPCRDDRVSRVQHPVASSRLQGPSTRRSDECAAAHGRVAQRPGGRGHVDATACWSPLICPAPGIGVISRKNLSSRDYGRRLTGTEFSWPQCRWHASIELGSVADRHTCEPSHTDSPHRGAGVLTVVVAWMGAWCGCVVVAGRGKGDHPAVVRGAGVRPP
jgi:hypothetical protein